MTFFPCALKNVFSIFFSNKEIFFQKWDLYISYDCYQLKSKLQISVLKAVGTPYFEDQKFKQITKNSIFVNCSDITLLDLFFFKV